MKNFFGEFKTFISKGNVLDMAVGVIMGAAFKAIIDSVVNDLLMPCIGMLMGGVDFSTLAVQVGSANLMYGNLIQNILNFVIVAFCLFLMIKGFNRLRKEEKVEEPAAEPVKSDEVLLLEEIRDLLSKK